ncbi:D-alanyl-D-alanine carboxypeptidase [Pontibacter sp. CAU 1760]
MDRVRRIEQRWSILVFLYCGFFFTSCTIQWQSGSNTPYSQKTAPAAIKKQIAEMEQRRQSFIGFALYDPEAGRMLVEHNADKYFMPASNTKLFTFYASQKMIGDSIPALKYTVRGDSLLFWDPCEVSLAQNDIRKSRAFDFLRTRPEKLYYINASHTELSNAINWGWDKSVLQSLSHTLKRPVNFIERSVPKDASVLYGLPSDTIYKRMLETDDNLLAEQLLILSSGSIADTLSTERAIQHVLSTYLADLPDKPIWVDGSGLSMMNMFTPRTFVALLQKMLKEQSQEKLFSLLAKKGNSNNYLRVLKSDIPAALGELGTLAHVQNQSGYIVTKSGKTLVYSFMNNNFKASSSDIQHEMVQIMTEVHKEY